MGELVYKDKGFVREDLENAYELYKRYEKELGYVVKNVILDGMKRGEFLMVYKDGVCVGVCNYHIKKGKVGVIYEVAVDDSCRGMGIGLELVNRVRRRCLMLQLKCPIDNESNKFYERIGFKKVGVIKGKKRELNVWRILGR